MVGMESIVAVVRERGGGFWSEGEVLEWTDVARTILHKHCSHVPQPPAQDPIALLSL